MAIFSCVRSKIFRKNVTICKYARYFLLKYFKTFSVVRVSVSNTTSVFARVKSGKKGNQGVRVNITPK